MMERPERLFRNKDDVYRGRLGGQKEGQGGQQRGQADGIEEQRGRRGCSGRKTMFTEASR
jgi:hypothetical protein